MRTAASRLRRRRPAGRRGGGDLDPPLAVHRLVRVDQQVREQLRQLMVVGLDLRQRSGGRRPSTAIVAARDLRIRQLHAPRERFGDPVCSTCSRIGLTNSSTSCTMALAILASAMMSVSTACASGNVGNLPAQQPRHHLDAGQRVLHLVRDGRRHLATAASRSRSRSRSSSCSTRVRSLKNIATPATSPASSRTSASV